MRLAGKIFMTSLPLKQQWGKARREKVFGDEKLPPQPRSGPYYELPL